jgi:small conductance mechanosensitive channel
MDILLESLQADWAALLSFAPKIFYAIVLLAFFLLVASFTGRLVGRIIRRSRKLRPNEAFLRHVVAGLITAIGVLLALGLMGFEGIATSMLATGGVVAIVLGFAFREIGENFLAGFFLTFSRPFELGDRVKTGDLTGTVKSIELRYVHIRTADACDVYVPSAHIFREPLYNYTQDGLRRPGFTIGVAYQDEPQQVIALLEDAVGQVTDVVAEPRPFATVKEFAAQYIEYEVFFWLDLTTSGRGLTEVSNDVKIHCWRALRTAGFTFSTDVSTGLEIHSLPSLDVQLQRSEQ